MRDHTRSTPEDETGSTAPVTCNTSAPGENAEVIPLRYLVSGDSESKSSSSFFAAVHLGGDSCAGEQVALESAMDAEEAEAAFGRAEAQAEQEGQDDAPEERRSTAIQPRGKTTRAGRRDTGRLDSRGTRRSTSGGDDDVPDWVLRQREKNRKRAKLIIHLIEVGLVLCGVLAGTFFLPRVLPEQFPEGLPPWKWLPTVSFGEWGGSGETVQAKPAAADPRDKEDRVRIKELTNDATMLYERDKLDDAIARMEEAVTIANEMQIRFEKAGTTHSKAGLSLEKYLAYAKKMLADWQEELKKRTAPTPNSKSTFELPGGAGGGEPMGMQ